MELASPLSSLFSDLQRTLSSLSTVLATQVPSVQSPLQQTLVSAAPSPPNRPLFTDLVRNSILSQPKSSPNFHRASSKLQKLRHSAKSGMAVYYKCGEIGHLTSVCRNALVCFSCGQTGHRSNTCRHLRPQPPPLAPLPPPPLLAPLPPRPLPHLTTTSAPVPSLAPTPSIQDTDPPMPQSTPMPQVSIVQIPPPSQSRLLEANTLPIMRFYATPATTRFRSTLSHGVVVTDVDGKGAQFIQSHLTQRFPIKHWIWVARELPNQQYLVASDLWRENEIRQLARDLGGVLLDSNPRSFNRLSMVGLRIKIGVPDKEVIPACRHLLFTGYKFMSTTVVPTIAAAPALAAAVPALAAAPAFAAAVPALSVTLAAPTLTAAVPTPSPTLTVPAPALPAPAPAPTATAHPPCQTPHRLWQS